MSKTILFFAFIVIINYSLKAQNIDQKPISIDSAVYVDSINYKKIQKPEVLDTMQSNALDSVKQPSIIINKTDTVFIYETRTFNPFRFLTKDTLHSPRLLLRPFLENGIYFLKNNVLKENYSTRSMFYYGFGFQIGHPQTFKIIPFAQINFSKYTIDKVLYQNTKADSSFSMKQIIVGVILPVYSLHDTYVRMKCGYSLSTIKDTFHTVDDSPFGLQLGLGIERRFIGNTRIYTDFSYLYQKSKNPNFKDFDMTRLSLGLAL